MFIVNCLLLLYGNRLNCIKFSTEFTKFEAKFSLLSTWVWGGFLSGFAVFRWVYPQKSTGYFGYLPGYPNPKSKWRLFGLSLGWFFVRFLPFLGEFTPQKPTGCFEYLPGYQNPESKWRLFDFARFFAPTCISSSSYLKRSALVEATVLLGETKQDVQGMGKQLHRVDVCLQRQQDLRLVCISSHLRITPKNNLL